MQALSPVRGSVLLVLAFAARACLHVLTLESDLLTVVFLACAGNLSSHSSMKGCAARSCLHVLTVESDLLTVVFHASAGTLTSHTSQRKAAGTNVLRPHARLLARLAKKFR